MRIKNPILRRELLHQQRTTPRVLQIVDSVGIIACVVVLTGLLIRILIQQFEPNSGAYGELQMIQWGQVFSWVVHALASIRAVVAGTEVIRRDSNGPNWDDLKLVNI